MGKADRRLLECLAKADLAVCQCALRATRVRHVTGDADQTGDLPAHRIAQRGLRGLPHPRLSEARVGHQLHHSLGASAVHDPRIVAHQRLALRAIGHVLRVGSSDHLRRRAPDHREPRRVHVEHPAEAILGVEQIGTRLAQGAKRCLGFGQPPRCCVLLRHVPQEHRDAAARAGVGPHDEVPPQRAPSVVLSSPARSPLSRAGGRAGLASLSFTRIPCPTRTFRRPNSTRFASKKHTCLARRHPAASIAACDSPTRRYTRPALRSAFSMRDAPSRRLPARPSPRRCRQPAFSRSAAPRGAPPAACTAAWALVTIAL